MKAILAVNNLGFIGLNNALPWNSKDDFLHFKKLTMNSTLLVGYNTYQTLPPLKGRTIILDTRDTETLEGIDWCIGGKKTYEKYAKHFTQLHISHIDDNSIGDTLFPDLCSLNPECRMFNYFFNTTEDSTLLKHNMSKSYLKVQIVETTQLLELVKDHPLMSDSLKQRLVELERELNIMLDTELLK